jgi:hypothetical protein
MAARGTPGRVIRIDDETWAAFGEACKDKGTSRADEIRRFVYAQVKAHKAERAETRAAGRSAT